MNQRSWLLGVLAPAMLCSTAMAASTNKSDLGRYVGADSRPPGIQLPASFLTVPADSPTTGTIANSATLDGDDEDTMYSFDINAGGNVSVYGISLNSCSASTNGFVVCSGATAAFFDNRVFPDARFGNRPVFAPFWDDLVAVPATSSIDFEYKANQRFTVIWRNFALYSNSAARLTFSVTFQVNAANGYIAFAYQKMEGAGADGASATIGYQTDRSWIFQNYAFNTTGAVLTGDAGSSNWLQSTMYDFDGDGDRLGATHETVLTTSDANHDSDTGGLDDGAELAAGKDPLAGGDDNAGADGDGDNLQDGDEAFYGTNPAVADTDGDSTMTTTLKDDEVYQGLNPIARDTDGDSIRDGKEIDDTTDPLNPQDFTSVPVPTANNYSTAGVRLWRPSITQDADGNFHMVATDPRSAEGPGIYYWMVDPMGSVLIPQTRLKSASRIWETGIAVHGGKIYVVGEVNDNATQSSEFLLWRLNPTAAPRDGNPIVANTIIELTKGLELATGAHNRNPSIAVGASGVHIAFDWRNEYSDDHSRDDDVKRGGYGYARYTLDGAFELWTPVISFSPNANGKIVHKNSKSMIALDAAGKAHYVFEAKRGRNGVKGDLYYASIAGSTLSGPYHIVPDVEWASIDLLGDKLFIGFNNAQRDPRRDGVAVLNTTSFQVVPRVGDAFDVKFAIAASSMLVAPTALPYDNRHVKSGIAARSDGNMILVYQPSSGSGQAFCFQPLGANGGALGPPSCGYNGQHRKFDRKISFAHTSDNGAILAMARSGPSNSSLTNLWATKFEPTLFDFSESQPINGSPTITTTPPAQGVVAVGTTYAYAAAAMDDTTPASSLTWSLTDGPPTMTVSAMGAVSWTPNSGEVGEYFALLRVCDNAPVVRCDEQTLHVFATNGGGGPGLSPPSITSTASSVAIVGLPYAYQIVATDPDNDVSTYAITAPMPLLGNMAVSTSGALTWTPTTADIGPRTITVQVSDVSALSTTQTFSVTVIDPSMLNPGNGLVFTTPTNTKAKVGDKYTYQVTAIDPTNSGATITYALASTAVAGMTVSPTGLVEWTPTSMQVGPNVAAITATAGARSGTQSYVIIVEGGGCQMVGSPVQQLGHTLGMLLLVGFALVAARLRSRSNHS